MGKQSALLAQAHSYWRLAAKAHKAGQYQASERYSKRAEKLFREHKRRVEYMEARKEQG